MSLIQQQTFTETPSPSRTVLPFLNTDPLFDVRWAMLLLPIWWWLGIEQFIWPVIFGVAAVKVLFLQRLRILINPPLRWFALFMLAILISGIFIVEPIRWLTFARNLGAFSAGFLVLLVISNRARSWLSINKLLGAALLAVMIAGVVGILAAADIWRPSFQSLAGQLLPSAAAGTSYGRSIAARTLGQVGWFTGLGVYFRLHAFFLFGTHFASAIVYTIPFLFYRLGQERRLRKIVLSLGILMLLINLIYTTGRVAMISLLVGALYFALFHSLRRGALRLLLTVGLSLTLVLVLFSALLELSSNNQEESIVGRAVDAAELVVFARGTGSFTSRFGVYEATVAGFVERPLFGWGTERDVEGLNIPAGSHSEYLAVLYRQGLFGLLAFIGLLWSAWRATRPPSGMAARQPAGAFLRYGRWFFVTALINSIMNDPAIDTTTYVLLWLLIALLIATAQLVRQQADHVVRNH